MSTSFESTVDLTLRTSMRALRWAFGLHALCLVLLMLAEPPRMALIGLAALIGLSWLFTRRHAALGFGPKAIQRMVWHADGRWTLYRGKGAAVDAELAPDSIVRGSMLLLRFRIDGEPAASRLILGDELPEESLRQLRARLSVA